MSENEKQKIDITLDTEKTEKLARENERLKIEKELKEKGINLDGKGLTDEQKLAKAEAEELNIKNIREDFYAKTGDEKFLHMTNKAEIKAEFERLLQIAVQTENKHETPAGSAPMNPQQYGTPQGITDLRKLPLNVNTIMFLQNERRKGSNPEANQILNELWAKAVQSWRSSGHQPLNYSPDDNIQKSNVTPDLNFDNLQANDENSELAKFGIRKSPLNYAKTHNQAGQKKE